MKRISAILICTMMILVTVAGCSNTGTQPSADVSSSAASPSSESTDSSPQVSDDPSSQAQISQEPSGEKELVMATNAKFPPFEFVTQQGILGTYDGIDVAIAMEIAKDMNQELRIDDMEFTAVLMALPSGKADFAAAGITATDERREKMDFSEPYYEAVQNMIVHKDNTTISSANDLKDKKVGAIEGYTGELVCRESLKLNPTSYKTAVDGIMDVKNKKIDVLVLDSHTAKALVSQNNDLKLVEDKSVFESEFYSIAVKKGNSELLDKINATINRLKSDGSLDKMIEKYGAEMAEKVAE